jgi:hypothetical protein
MVFKCPSWVPELPWEIPTSTLLGDFVLAGNKELRKKDIDRTPLVCAISGKSYSIETLNEKVDLMARSLSKELGWSANKGESRDKVLGIFSFNSVNFAPLCLAL